MRKSLADVNVNHLIMLDTSRTTCHPFNHTSSFLSCFHQPYYSANNTEKQYATDRKIYIQSEVVSSMLLLFERRKLAMRSMKLVSASKWWQFVAIRCPALELVVWITLVMPVRLGSCSPPNTGRTDVINKESLIKSLA